MWHDGIDKEVDRKFYGKFQQFEIGSPILSAFRNQRKSWENFESFLSQFKNVLLAALVRHKKTIWVKR